MQVQDSTAAAEREQTLRRLAGRYFFNAAYQDDAALRQFARAVWTLGFRAGHAAGRDEVR